MFCLYATHSKKSPEQKTIYRRYSFQFASLAFLFLSTPMGGLSSCYSTVVCMYCMLAASSLETTNSPPTKNTRMAIKNNEYLM